MHTGLTPSFFRNVDWTGVLQAGVGRVGPFALRGPLGRGAHAEVWRGSHVATGTSVALRFDTGESSQNAGDWARLHARVRAGARALARLRHPGIVRVLDVGVAGEEPARVSGGRVHALAPYTALEHLRGGPFRDGVRRVSNDDRTVLWLESLLDALAETHAHQMIHGDIKPSNVLFRDFEHTQPVWIDFSLADELGSPSLGERSEQEYAAPEELRARPVGPHTDVYRFALLAWEMLTGVLPGREAPRRRLFGAPSLEQLAPDGIREWVRTALSPKSRFANAADALRAWKQTIHVPAGVADHAPAIADRLREYEVGSTFSLELLRRPSFIGRQAQREELSARIEALACDGRSFVYAVHGPAGVGKSRLLEWASTRAFRSGVAPTSCPAEDVEGLVDRLSSIEHAALIAVDGASANFVDACVAAAQRIDAPFGLLLSSTDPSSASYRLATMAAAERETLRTAIGLHPDVVYEDDAPGPLIRRVTDDIERGSLKLQDGWLVRHTVKVDVASDVDSAAHTFAQDVLCALAEISRDIGPEWSVACAGIEPSVRAEALDRWLMRGWVSAAPGHAGERGFRVRDPAPLSAHWQTLSPARQQALAQTCVLALEGRDDGDAIVKRAQHRLAASPNAPDEADIVAVVEAAGRLLQRLRASEALAILSKIADSPTTAALETQRELARARAFRLLGDSLQASSALHAARAHAARTEDPTWRLRCARRAASLARSSGDHDEAVRMSLRALGLAKRIGDWSEIGASTVDLIASNVLAGLEVPASLYSGALAAFEKTGDRSGIVETKLWRARSLFATRSTGVEDALEDAEREWTRATAHPGVLALRARLRANAGDLQSAEQSLVLAAETYVRMGHGLSTDVEFRLAGVQIWRGALERAWHTMENASRALQARGRIDVAQSADLGWTVFDVAEQDFARFDSRVATALELGRRPPSSVFSAVARTLKWLEEAGESARAERLRQTGVDFSNIW